MKRYAITLFCLVVAIVLYTLGAILPATILLILGGVAEIVFWTRLFGGKRHGN